MKNLTQDMPVCFETVEYTLPYNRDLASAQLSAHGLVEISIVLEGSGSHCILNREIPCKDGDVYITNANIPHGFFTNREGERIKVRNIYFDPTHRFNGNASDVSDPDFCYGVFRENSVSAYAMLNADTQKELNDLCAAITRELEGKLDQWQTAVNAHLCMLLITLGRYINGAIKNLPSAPSKEWAIVSAAINMIMEEYGDSNLTTESVAAKLFVSTSYLARRFNQLTGESLSKYLRTFRIGQACKLLSDTDLKVEEIVARCGLKDMASFYRVFATQTGMTPSHYRNLERKGDSNCSSLLDEISKHVQAGLANEVTELVKSAIDAGFSASEIINDGLLAGMNEVGALFKCNEIYVPEVIIAARALNMGVELLKPILVAEGIQPIGKICIGTVHGDLHDIGKNIVKMMLESKGFEVIDLGTDVPAREFIDAAIEQGCNIICCSALLTTTISVMADVVEEAKAAGIRDKVKIMVGGAPVSETFCKQIGADAYTPDAASCADKAYELIMKEKQV